MREATRILGSSMLLALLSVPNFAHAGSEYIEGKTTVEFKDDQPPPLGPVGFRYNVTPRAVARAVYDDNIFLGLRSKEEDFIFTLGAGVNITIGDYESRTENFLSVDYLAGTVLFADHSGENAFTQNFLFEGQIRFTKLTLGLRQTFDQLEGTSVDTGAIEIGDRVRLLRYATTLTANYELSDKTSLLGIGDFTVNDYEAQLDSIETRGQLIFNYLATPKVNVGLGGTYGHLDVDGQPAQNYEQLRVNLGYKPTPKLTFNGDAGVEFRQTDQRDDQTNPVFRLNGQWKPFVNTTLDVGAHREVRASAVLLGQNYVVTGVDATIGQRIFQRVLLSVNGGIDHVEYEAADAGVSARRDYDYFFVRPSLRFDFTRRGTAEIFYLHRELDGNQPALGFTNNQVGVQFDLVF